MVDWIMMTNQENPTQQSKDNYRSTHASIAKYILSHCGAYVKDTPRLNAAAMGLTTAFGLWTFLSVNFKLADTDCHLAIEVKTINIIPETDENGDEWYQYTLNCTVNFPCHGASDPKSVKERLKLYQAVTSLAEDIEYVFGGDHVIWRLYRSASEVVKQDAEREARRLEEKVRQIADANRKQLRPGCSRPIFSHLVNNVPSGRYAVQFDNRQFIINVTEHVGAEIQRVI